MGLWMTSTLAFLLLGVALASPVDRIKNLDDERVLRELINLLERQNADGSNPQGTDTVDVANKKPDEGQQGPPPSIPDAIQPLDQAGGTSEDKIPPASNPVDDGTHDSRPVDDGTPDSKPVDNDVDEHTSATKSEDKDTPASASVDGDEAAQKPDGKKPESEKTDVNLEGSKPAGHKPERPPVAGADDENKSATKSEDKDKPEGKKHESEKPDVKPEGSKPDKPERPPVAGGMFKQIAELLKNHPELADKLTKGNKPAGDKPGKAPAAEGKPAGNTGKGPIKPIEEVLADHPATALKLASVLGKGSKPAGDKPGKPPVAGGETAGKKPIKHIEAVLKNHPATALELAESLEKGKLLLDNIHKALAKHSDVFDAVLGYLKASKTKEAMKEFSSKNAQENFNKLSAGAVKGLKPQLSDLKKLNKLELKTGFSPLDFDGSSRCRTRCKDPLDFKDEVSKVRSIAEDFKCIQDQVKSARATNGDQKNADTVVNAFIKTAVMKFQLLKLHNNLKCHKDADEDKEDKEDKDDENPSNPPKDGDKTPSNPPKDGNENPPSPLEDSSTTQVKKRELELDSLIKLLGKLKQ